MLSVADRSGTVADSLGRRAAPSSVTTTRSAPGGVGPDTTDRPDSQRITTSQTLRVRARGGACSSGGQVERDRVGEQASAEGQHGAAGGMVGRLQQPVGDVALGGGPSRRA